MFTWHSTAECQTDTGLKLPQVEDRERMLNASASGSCLHAGKTRPLECLTVLKPAQKSFPPLDSVYLPREKGQNQLRALHLRLPIAIGMA